jgi:hypothetical protein
MIDEGAVLEGTLQWMELVDDADQPMGLAVLIGEQDLLGLLSELEGRNVRISIEVLDSEGDGE